MSYYLIAFTNIALFALAFTLAVSRFKLLDRAMRFLCLSCGLSLFSECLALYTVVHYHTNTPVYAIYNIADMAILCLYFNYSVDLFRRKHTGIYLAGISVLAGTLNLLYLQPPDQLSNNFIYYEGILIIIMCMFSMRQHLLRSENNEQAHSPHFLVASLLLMFWVLSFLNWGLYDFMYVHLTSQRWLINNAMIFICGMMNIGFSFVFYFYPKTQTYAR